MKHCSNLLVLLHQLRHEELESTSRSSFLNTASEEKDDDGNNSFSFSSEEAASEESSTSEVKSPSVLGESQAGIESVGLEREPAPSFPKSQSAGLNGEPATAKAVDLPDEQVLVGDEIGKVEPNPDLDSVSSESVFNVGKSSVERVRELPEEFEEILFKFSSYGDFFRATYKEHLKNWSKFSYSCPLNSAEGTASASAEMYTRWSRKYFDELSIEANRSPPAHHLYIPPDETTVYDEEYDDYLQAVHEEA